jgi:nitrate/nitrite-specific signal transduction histidine kinase
MTLVTPNRTSGSRKTRRRSISGLIVRMMRRVQLDAGLRGTVQSLADELARALSARRIVIAAQEKDTERAFLWDVRPSDPDRAESNLQISELNPAQRATYFFAAPEYWSAVQSGTASSGFMPDGFTQLHDAHSCVSVAFEFGSAWTCRLFVFDVRSRRPSEEALGLVRRVVRALSPAVYNVYSLHKLQSNAAAVERATLARALHDDLIQGLISAEMRVHAIRRRVADASVAAELDRIETILHAEILSVRDFMQRIKPIRLESDELLEFLADHVQKFGSDTGIKASFFADVRQVSLPAAMCSEVARVVQEALSNVRKHSGAHRVSVHLAENSGRWSLIIEDDGKGLGEPPHLPSPAVIKECIRSLRGELELRSAASGGLRLEIAFQSPLQIPMVNAGVAEATAHRFPQSIPQDAERR